MPNAWWPYPVMWPYPVINAPAKRLTRRPKPKRKRK
jgi:hypothetical protein